MSRVTLGKRNFSASRLAKYAYFIFPESKTFSPGKAKAQFQPIAIEQIGKKFTMMGMHVNAGGRGHGGYQEISK